MERETSYLKRTEDRRTVKRQPSLENNREGNENISAHLFVVHQIVVAEVDMHHVDCITVLRPKARALSSITKHVSVVVSNPPHDWHQDFVR